MESLENIASEIIVVNNGSDDTTVEIANKHNCKILYSPNHLGTPFAFGMILLLEIENMNITLNEEKWRRRYEEKKVSE